MIEYHKQTQSPWLSEEDRKEAARVFCEQAYSKLSADDLENEIDLILAEEERNYNWQERIQNGAYGKELVQQEGYTNYALKQYYQDGAENPKKGVVVIVKDGKIQSMMPSDPKSFEKLQ